MLAKMTLIGNLTADPTVKEVTVRGEKREVVEFSLAVNNPFNKEEPASFYNQIEAWNGMGQTIKKFATKGSPLFVEADAKMRSDEKDGVKRNHLNLTVTAVRLLKSRSDSSSEGRYENAPPSETEQTAAPVAATEAVATEAPVETPVEEPAAVEAPEQEQIPVPF